MAKLIWKWNQTKMKILKLEKPKWKEYQTLRAKNIF